MTNQHHIFVVLYSWINLTSILYMILLKGTYIFFYQDVDDFEQKRCESNCAGKAMKQRKLGIFYHNQRCFYTLRIQLYHHNVIINTQQKILTFIKISDLYSYLEIFMPISYRCLQFTSFF